MNIRGIEIAA